ncbi:MULTISPECIES: hypothetical protein [Nonomuraea]|uniref:Uncharacterized protein n=1 Tax=Nonomuraea mangrovi TaxID=2316207 RepID=A0ABW4TE69_9ACTN
MSDQPYEISQDMGDDVQESSIAMYKDSYPERHHINEIDDECTRGIFHWMNEEDRRVTDAHPDPLEEPRSFNEDL